jgi:hypothetical protein
MEFNDFLSQQRDKIQEQLILENDKKIVSTIIDISQGKYDCYGDYYVQHQKEVEEYERVKEEINKFEGKPLAVIYIPPSPLLSEELFNYIVVRGKNGTY